MKAQRRRRPANRQSQPTLKGPTLKVICTQPHDAERDKLAEELAGLRGDVKALKSERDETAERNRLRDQIAELKREKATLTEEGARKIRETEHKTGLLRTKQEHDVEH